MKKTILLIVIVFINISAYATNQTFSVEHATIESIHKAINEKQLSCEQLIGLYLARIKKFNLSVTKNPPINAFTELNPNALDEARQLDKVFVKSKQRIGRLHCIPVVVKDNINTYDITTTSGSLALLGNQPTQDAFVVSQLRNEGAIIIGKGGMDELASGLFGISSRSGRIGNVYNSEKNSGGSSGGPAVAVSAHFAVIGIGTDNSGSIRIPAAFNGIYGLRPSNGLISQRGIFPAGNLDGTAGPLTNNVMDLALVMEVIAQEDPLEDQTHHVPSVKNYSLYLNPKGLQGKRIGIIHHVGNRDTFIKMPNDILNRFNKSVILLKQLGATIVDNIDLSKFNNNRELNMAGMRQDIDQYLSSFPAVRKNYQDLCDSNRTRVFGEPQKCIAFFASMPIKFGRKYKQALTNFAKNKKYVEMVMAQNHLDALLLPISTIGIATYNPYEINTWLAPVSSNSGLPSLSINFAYNQNNMPIGVEIIGKQFGEGGLIEIAYAYEKNTPSKIYPKMPEPNLVLKDLDIPNYNNLITKIGYRTYMDVLIKGGSNTSEELSPKQFQAIAHTQINQFASLENINVSK